MLCKKTNMSWEIHVVQFTYLVKQQNNKIPMSEQLSCFATFKFRALVL